MLDSCIKFLNYELVFLECDTFVEIRTQIYNSPYNINNSRPPKNGGDPCVGQLSQVAGCNSITCPEDVRHEVVVEDPIDCEWGPWGEWENCSATCDGGQSLRHRQILTMPNASGKPCAYKDSIQIQQCGEEPCSTTDCVFSEWCVVYYVL